MKFSFMDGQARLTEVFSCVVPFFLDHKLCRPYRCAIRQRQSRLKARFDSFFQCSLYACKIDLIHVFFRCQKLMRQRTVVRDEKQSFRINIEASDREEVFSLCFINKVNDSLIAPVFRCGNDALWFI